MPVGQRAAAGRTGADQRSRLDRRLGAEQRVPEPRGRSAPNRCGSSAPGRAGSAAARSASSASSGTSPQHAHVLGVVGSPIVAPSTSGATRRRAWPASVAVPPPAARLGVRGGRLRRQRQRRAAGRVGRARPARRALPGASPAERRRETATRSGRVATRPTVAAAPVAVRSRRRSARAAGPRRAAGAWRPAGVDDARPAGRRARRRRCRPAARRRGRSTVDVEASAAAAAQRRPSRVTSGSTSSATGVEQRACRAGRAAGRRAATRPQRRVRAVDAGQPACEQPVADRPLLEAVQLDRQRVGRLVLARQDRAQPQPLAQERPAGCSRNRHQVVQVDRSPRRRRRQRPGQERRPRAAAARQRAAPRRTTRVEAERPGRAEPPGSKLRASNGCSGWRTSDASRTGPGAAAVRSSASSSSPSGTAGGRRRRCARRPRCR